MSLLAHAQHITKDIPYTAPPEAVQTADLYQPVGPGPFPAVIYIHGGSWRSGNKSDFRRLATDLAARGYVGFSIDYDLNPHSFPASWQQAATAVRFLRAHALEYHVDPSQIVVAGTSAGGELAALVALAPDGPASAPSTEPSTVAAAIILNGALNLNSPTHVVTRYLGAGCANVQPVCDDASPIRHIHAGAPPFFIGHGTADTTVPFVEAQAFVAGLHQQEVPVKLDAAEGGPHMYWTKKAFYGANLSAIEGFLATTLHPAIAATR